MQTGDFNTVLREHYQSYLDGFRDDDDTLPAMLKLKHTHTLGVIKNARAIMQGEQWPATEWETGVACALLHDIGRYSQFAEFGTFQDARSINHAHRGVQVIVAHRWLEPLPAATRNLILGAIALHNRRNLPPTLPPELAKFAQLVRDADKLDIFRVLTTALEDGSITRHPEIAWGLAHKVEPSPLVIQQIERGETVSYSQIQSLTDFILVQVGWLCGGLYFNASYRLAHERRILEILKHYLAQLGDFTGVTRCLQKAEGFLTQASGFRGPLPT